MQWLKISAVILPFFLTNETVIQIKQILGKILHKHIFELIRSSTSRITKRNPQLECETLLYYFHKEKAKRKERRRSDYKNQNNKDDKINFRT